jgi:hypothetical protein
VVTDLNRIDAFTHFCNDARSLVPEHYWSGLPERCRQRQIRSADTATMQVDRDMTWSRGGNVDLLDVEGLTGIPHYCCSHQVLFRLVKTDNGST